MRGRGFFLLVAVGVGAMGIVACGGAEFTADCEGEECASAKDDAGAPDGASDSDVGDADDGSADCDAALSPADEPCTIDERYAVFVSPLGDDAEGRGDREAPFGTLAKGLTEAKVSGKRLYVCDDGTGYTEQLVIDHALDGLEVFGGFDCETWSYGAGKALLGPLESGVPLRIDGLTEGLSLRDFAIRAPDATEPGESSIGVLVHASASVVFESVDIEAGAAEDGANGLSASGPAESGADGNPGNRASCEEESNPGGAAATWSCGSEATTGGRGGSGGQGENTAGAGNPGLPASMPNGEEGVGEGSSECSAGRPGANGDPGDAGDGASGIGTLDANGWTGASGQSGSVGGVGQGGGGGGGAKAPGGCLGTSSVGASGGSGGAGGCGGRGGGGGSAGGSSIALVSIDSEITLDECTLSSKAAGRGGEGGAGQKGGAGGSAGAGGSGANGSSVACSGGKGGRGGDGGPGGGGAGGHSLGIAYVGTKPNRIGGAITVGEAGVGGEPGAGGPPSGRGESGRQAEELEF